MEYGIAGGHLLIDYQTAVRTKRCPKLLKFVDRFCQKVEHGGIEWKAPLLHFCDVQLCGHAIGTGNHL